MSCGILAHSFKAKALFVLQEYPDQALLLLVTGALGMRILRCPPKPVLPVLSTFKVIFSLSPLMCHNDISSIK